MLWKSQEFYLGKKISNLNPERPIGSFQQAGATTKFLNPNWTIQTDFLN